MSKNERMPEWDLSEYYADVDDKKIDEDIALYAKKAAAFAEKYRGRVAELSADEFLEALKEQEVLSNIASKLGGFAGLNSSTKLTDPKSSALYQKVTEALNAAGANLLFFALEYNAISEEQEKKLLSDERIAFYKPYLKRVRKFKPYELSEDIEKTLLEKDVTSGSAWVRFYEEFMSRLSYTVDGKTYNEAEVGKFCLSPDAKIREEAGKEINRVSKENSFQVGYIYNMIMKDKAVEDEKRGFKLPMSSRNLSEDVSDEIVTSLAETVRDNYKNIAWRFYKLKAKLLGVEKIQYWDRNAPLPFESDKAYSWDEAVKTVLNAYNEFSPKLYTIARDFFDKPWIDVAPKEGKRGGAFCSGPLVEEHPFLLLNFVGKRNDVLTLAHELGHGCHHQLRRENGILNETTRMTTEEVASVFGEMLVFQSMLNNATSKEEKISLLAMKVNDMINTAIRQIAFHFFETRAHDERKNGEVPVERLNEIWLEEMRASLGPSVEVDENSAHIWEQIGHFFFLPFYVYAYSFADCVVNSLYWLKLQGKVENFEEKYLKLLSQTAIGDYKDIFAPFGLNPESKEFWQGGLNLIAYYLDELEKLL
ncbi:MAG: M3 family oligoendopeptidase [Acetobacter sp.]|nr:M3 family oligoendopeptidase [Acetobacter sp.]